MAAAKMADMTSNQKTVLVYIEQSEDSIYLERGEDALQRRGVEEDMGGLGHICCMDTVVIWNI